MTRLPTVKLVHKRTGQTLIRNLTEYQMDMGRWAQDWKILSIRGGDADDAEIRQSIREWKVEKMRRTDPEEVRKRGDAQRTFDHRTIRDNVTTSHEHNSDPEPEAPAEPEPDWTAMPWIKARVYVKEKTGVLPRSWDHIRELMGATDAGL